ncbi:MAG: signal peptidase I [Deltaproteobacteria bacterium]|nr:MAG: signal peptidase I [Deltaproteobacteria bacterium]
MSSEPGPSGPKTPPAPASKPTGQMSWFNEQVRTWGPAIFAVLFIRTFIFEPFRIPSGSMLPTLLVGDFVFVNKASYGLWVPGSVLEVPYMDSAVVLPRYEIVDWGDPERGDIIVFRYPRNESVNFIKRVVAVPGDRLQVRNNKLVINGEEQPMEYTGRETFLDQYCNAREVRAYKEDIKGLEHWSYTNSSGLGGPLSNHREVTVPPGHVFAMGDNRDNSEDSRAWGFVRYDQIKGKAHFVWLSLDSCGEGANGKPATLGTPRSERFFKGLYSMEREQ